MCLKIEILQQQQKRKKQKQTNKQIEQDPSEFICLSLNFK